MKVVYIVTKSRKAVIKLEGAIKIFEDFNKYYIKTFIDEEWETLGIYRSLRQSMQILFEICQRLESPKDIEIYPMPLQ